MTFPCQTRAGCPGKRLEPSAKGFCPAWFENDIYGRVMTERNTETGDTRMVKGCFFTVFPTMLVHTTRESGSVAAEVSKLRSVTAEHISRAVRDEVRGALLDMLSDLSSQGVMLAAPQPYLVSGPKPKSETEQPNYGHNGDNHQG